MRVESISRRTVLAGGALALVATAGIRQIAEARTEAGLSPKGDELIRKYYAAWERKEWNNLNALLAEDFTFSSPFDDHISKSAYKQGCWDTQSDFIKQFDLQQLSGSAGHAFVMYVCHTMNGKTFRNVEYFQLRDDKVKAVECYFGGKASFPSAVSAGQS
jgi:hypothetical protein